MKKCSKCGQMFPEESFYKSGRPGGLAAACKKCHGTKVITCKVCSKKFVGKTGAKLCSDRCRRLDRPQTFKICTYCKKEFGPVSHLSRVYCSQSCKILSQTTGKTSYRVTSREARYAQSLVAYYVRVGRLTRPNMCEICKSVGNRIEASHSDYSKPLDIRWLCISCHRKLDKKSPKGVTKAVPIHL